MTVNLARRDNSASQSASRHQIRRGTTITSAVVKPVAKFVTTTRAAGANDDGLNMSLTPTVDEARPPILPVTSSSRVLKPKSAKTSKEVNKLQQFHEFLPPEIAGNSKRRPNTSEGKNYLRYIFFGRAVVSF